MNSLAQAAAAPQQQREEDLKRQRHEHGVIVPANKTSAIARNDTAVNTYLAEFGVGMDGTFFKFAKDGKFRTTSDDTEIPEGTELVVVYDQIQAGWIKFNGKGHEPDRRMGPIFDGFMPPPRESLGDMDESLWEEGLDGKPADPWQHQMLVPLQNPKTDELFIFNTTSITGRREVGNLIKHCARTTKKEPDIYPVVKLQVGGFAHRDERVGWVKTPKFVVVGSAPKDDTVAATSAIGKDLNDTIPF
jgi:hypothetical protein